MNLQIDASHPRPSRYFRKHPVVFCSVAFIKPETSGREISLPGFCFSSGLWGSPGSWHQHSSPSRLWKRTNSRKIVIRCCVAAVNPTWLRPSEDMCPGKIVCWLPLTDSAAAAPYSVEQGSVKNPESKGSMRRGAPGSRRRTCSQSTQRL